MTTPDEDNQPLAQPTPTPAVPATGLPGRETKTEKLGPIAAQPQDSIFKLQRRMPGWRPDTQGNCTTRFFQEEVLGIENGKLKYFPPPEAAVTAGKAPCSFAEPAKDASPAEWNSFNSWVLGHPMKKKGTSNFDDFLRDIADQVRRYNAALYWMRRLHFVENAIPGSPPPPRNPSGDKDPGDPKDPSKPALPLDPASPIFSLYVSSAEQAWKRETSRLNRILCGETQSQFKDIVADMVEVNSYIVSMRIIANENKTTASGVGVLDQRIQEFGGSSSSHVSISSALSSPSP